MPHLHVRRAARAPLAFSLVELSIVLVILGLLVGGILAGKSLIRASELRSVMTDAQRFVTGIAAFRDKYFGLPGDITNATSIWGTAGGTGNGPSCFNTVSTDASTCNGNGDGVISAGNESFRIWQQLANAGLIPGQFTGTSSDANYADYGAVSLQNVPTSRLASGYWYVMSNGTYVSGNGAFYDGQYGNILQLGAYTTLTTSPYASILKAEEMWNIDTKMDDGAPATGRIKARINATSCTNTITTTDMTATYNVSSTGIYCTPVFLTGF